MNLCDYNTIRDLLARHGFHFSKSMGQNFLIDPEVPRRIAEASGADAGCGAVSSDFYSFCASLYDFEAARLHADTLSRQRGVGIVEENAHAVVISHANQAVFQAAVRDDSATPDRRKSLGYGLIAFHDLRPTVGKTRGEI